MQLSSLSFILMPERRDILYTILDPDVIRQSFTAASLSILTRSDLVRSSTIVASLSNTWCSFLKC